MITLPDILGSKVLIVDDQQANVLLLERMLSGAGYTAVTSTREPRDVLELHRQHRYDLILLDVQMPGLDGFGVMAALKEIETDGYLPVLTITAQPNHKLHALQAGAKDFITKPFELAEVLARVHNLLEVRLLQRELRDHAQILEERVRLRTAELQAGYLETIYALTRAAEHKDEDTGAHVQRISYYSEYLAGQLGLGPVFGKQLFFASPMHDVGKIGIPDSILLKQGSLTAVEWDVMRDHTAMGARILGRSNSPYMKMGAEIALNHHEHWDGSGYPNGARGEAIPLSARVMNICDVYDALRSKRPYKPALPHDQAVDIITRGDGRTEPAHFDPVILGAFASSHAMFDKIFSTYAE